MLNVSEKTIKRWQTRLEIEQALIAKEAKGDHEIFSNLLKMKEEPPMSIDDDDDYF